MQPSSVLYLRHNLFLLALYLLLLLTFISAVTQPAAEMSSHSVTASHWRTGEKMADTDTRWGLPDSVATIGRVFRYSLVPQDAIDNSRTRGDSQHYYQMSAEEEKNLPSWLYWNEKSNSLEGVATPDQKDQLTNIRVTHIQPTGKVDAVSSSVESFTVKIVDSEEQGSEIQRYGAKTKPEIQTIKCDKLSSSTRAALLIDINFSDLSSKDRVDLLENLSAYLNLSVTVLKILSGDFQPSWQEDALVAGPGDTTEPKSPPGSLIQWMVGCGNVAAPHMKLLELLESSARNGALGKAVGYGVLGWHVTNTRGIVHSRSKRRAYLHPRPTPTQLPSLLYPTGYPAATKVHPQNLPWSVWLRPQLEIAITTKSSGIRPPTKLTDEPSHSLASSSSKMIQPTRTTERGYMTSMTELYSNSVTDSAAGKVNMSKTKDTGYIEPSMEDIRSTVIVPTASLPEWSRRSTKIDPTPGLSTEHPHTDKPDAKSDSTTKVTKKPRTKKKWTTKVPYTTKSTTRSHLTTISPDKTWDTADILSASPSISSIDITPGMSSVYDFTEEPDRKADPSSKYPQSDKESFEKTTKHYYSETTEDASHGTSSTKVVWSTAEFGGPVIHPDHTIKFSQTDGSTIYPEMTTLHQYTDEAVVHPEKTSEHSHTTESGTYPYRTAIYPAIVDESLVQPSGTTGYPFTDGLIVHPGSSQRPSDTDRLHFETQRTVLHTDGSMGQPHDTRRYPYTVESTVHPDGTAKYTDIHRTMIHPEFVSIYPSTDKPILQPKQSITYPYTDGPVIHPEETMKNSYTEEPSVHLEDSTRYHYTEGTFMHPEKTKTGPQVDDTKLHTESTAVLTEIRDTYSHDKESTSKPVQTTIYFPVDESVVQPEGTAAYQPTDGHWDHQDWSSRGPTPDELTPQTIGSTVYPSIVKPERKPDISTTHPQYQEIEPSYAVDVTREFLHTVHPSATSDYIWISKDPHPGDIDQPGSKASRTFDEHSTMAYPTIDAPYSTVSKYETSILLPSTTTLSQDVISTMVLMPTTKSSYIVASTILQSSSTQILTTAIKFITTEKIHTSTVSELDLMDSGPRLVKSLQKLEVEAGTLLWFRIPRDTFFDEEDGTTENLKLSVLMYEDRTTVQPTSWIKLNESSHTLYGLPLNDHSGKYNFIVAAIDKDGYIAESPLEVTVKKSTTTDKINHQFSIKLDIDYNKFNYDVDTRLAVLNQLAKAFGDSDSSKITVTGISEGSVVIRWTNNTLPLDPCPEEVIKTLRYIMLLPNGSVNQTFARAMRPYKVLSADGETLGVCVLDTDDVTPTTADPVELLTPQFEDPREPARKELPAASNYLLYIIIAIIVFLILVLVIIILCVVCYKRKRTRSEKQENEDKLGGANKGIPIIFADELEDQSGIIDDPDDVASPGSTLKSVKSNRNSDPISTVPPPEYPRSKPGSASSTLRSDWKAPLLSEHEDVADEDSERLDSKSRHDEGGERSDSARNTREREISNSDTLPAR